MGRRVPWTPWSEIESRVGRCLENIDGMATVYALLDPHDERIRYIHYTTLPLQRQLVRHIAAPINSVMRSWFDHMSRRHYGPVIRAITYCHPDDAPREASKWVEVCGAYGRIMILSEIPSAPPWWERAARKRARVLSSRGVSPLVGTARRLSPEEIAALTYKPPRDIRHSGRTNCAIPWRQTIGEGRPGKDSTVEQSTAERVCAVHVCGAGK